MKRLFTLIAGLLLVASGSFAQNKWTSIIENGNMEGAQDPLWSCFWVHDWRQEADFDPASNQRFDENSATEVSKGQFQGFAEIVVDPDDPNNHCARVIVRSKAEADEAGNPTTDSGNGKPDWTEWDSQFFIYAKETIPTGKELRMTLKVKGEKAGTFQTQAHYDPGNYNHYQLYGDIKYGTDWTPVEVTAKITGDHTQEANGKFMQSVAFNLSTMEDGNVIYFDEIKLEVKDPEGLKPFSQWFNFLTEGTQTAALMPSGITLASGEPCYNFTGREGTTNTDVSPATIVNDPIDGQPALRVSSIGWTKVETEEVPVLDEEGNPTYDEEGKPVVEIKENHYYVTEKGDTLTSIDNWRTQFFVTIPHSLQEGEQFRLVMSARADKPVSIETQAHINPGGYKWWSMLDGFSSLTETWPEEDLVFEQTVSADQAGMNTIAFNCNVTKDFVNYYFRFKEFSVNEAEVTDFDRIVGEEEIMLPVPGKDKEVTVKLDMSKLAETLAIDDLVTLINEDKMMVITEEGYFSGGLQATTGAFIDLNGHYIEKEEGINFTWLEDGIEGNLVPISIYNLGDDFTKGQRVITRILFSNGIWNYVYNVTFTDEETYTGIEDVKAIAPKNAGVIYDLTGRKVVKMSKGIYIKDGKKFIMK